VCLGLVFWFLILRLNGLCLGLKSWFQILRVEGRPDSLGWIHMMIVSHYVIDWGWRIRLGKIALIPRDGATCIVSRPRCTIENLCSKLVGGCRNVDMGAETALDSQLRLLLIHSLRLYCKAWKTIVDRNAEYNALCLAQYEYAMCSNDVIRVCLPRKHNLITQFQHNLMWFSHSRHVSSNISRRILMSDLGDLSLRKLNWLS
jgi:hypothetical protein